MARPRLIDEGLQLPTDIIQCIQSFMDDDEAAQTSVLSKSWYNAWSTGPILYFIENSRFSKSIFWDFVTKKMNRYRNSNRKIDRLVFEMNSDNENEDEDGVVKDESYFASMVDKLIDDALNLRVNALELNFEGIFRYSYAIRSQVFSHKYLTLLWLANCQVYCLGKVLCSDLVYLSLEDVSIHESTFKNILAGCPKIEFLNLSGEMKALKRINASELKNLETLVAGNALKSTAGICGQFLNLTRLVLDHIVVYQSFFVNLSSNFPKLECLALENLDCNSIEISSHSIKRLSLRHPKYTNIDLEQFMAKFDVPNIEKFKFSGRHIPALSLTASSEWKSKIMFSNYDGGIIDLSRLRELLIELDPSKISLHLNVTSSRNIALGRSVENLPAVEKLTYYVMKPCVCIPYNFFVECLLSCRPKLVSFTYCSDMKAIPFLYEKLIKQMNQNGFTSSTQESSSLGMNDLKEVTVELLEESLKQWQPTKASSHDLEILNHGPERLHFKLKWESLLPEYTIIEFVTYNRIK